MQDLPPRTSFFDASALAKVFTKEHGSEFVFRYFYEKSPTKFTTPFCVYETLNVIKSQWMHRNKITKDEYIEACSRLSSWYRLNRKFVTDLDLFDHDIYIKTTTIAEKYSLDLSDAFQILTVKEGDFSFFIEHAKTMLVTADKKLFEAAQQEGLIAWYCLDEKMP